MIKIHLVNLCLSLAPFLGCNGWTQTPLSSRRHLSGTKLFQSSDAATGSDVNIVASTGDEKSINEAAIFLVESFWLGTPRQQTDATVSISDSVKGALVAEQAEDLMGKYGERMGKPLLKNCLLAAKNENKEIVGVVCLQELLLDRKKGDILSAEASESLLKNTVASMGPKQRRQYQKSSAKEIAEQLLPPDQETVVCFSNLSVSPNARRKGIAAKLCSEVERISKKWDYDSVFLKVESENESARNLYEKMKYVEEMVIESDPAIRLDNVAGEFIEIETPSIILSKPLS